MKPLQFCEMSEAMNPAAQHQISVCNWLNNLVLSEQLFYL